MLQNKLISPLLNARKNKEEILLEKREKENHLLKKTSYQQNISDCVYNIILNTTQNTVQLKYELKFLKQT